MSDAGEAADKRPGKRAWAKYWRGLSPKAKLVLAIVAAIVVLSFIGHLVNPDDNSSGVDVGYNAFTTCKAAVAEVLKAPASAKWPDYTEATIDGSEPDYTVSSHVDSQNSFGALIRSEYRCRVHHDPGEHIWQTVGLRFDGRDIY